MESRIIHKLEPVISEVKKKTGINIKNFKGSFLERRIIHRMCDVGISDYDEYVKFLSTNFNEAGSLYDSFSINVTKFFRDPNVWKIFEQEIMPNFCDSNRSSSILAWSCGSSTGEETHSLSILLNESLNKQIKYKIFGTDINDNAIVKAKKGIYKKESLLHVNEQQLTTYFEKLNDDQFQVKPIIKNKIEYEKSDMMKMSGKLFDIIFCRNVLIYYDKNAHEIIFKKFFDLLKKDGVLVLGQDESMIGTKNRNYFNLLYPRERIYQKKN
jgi:chemotaxis protein methyltransferase CheR